MTAAGTRRVYFALWPDGAQQAELAEATRQAVVESRGRAIPAGNLHVTLAFLGSVPEARLAEVRAVGARVSGNARSSESCLAFTQLECWKRADALCAVAEGGDPVATSIADELKQQLLGAGFAPDLKPFRPHVTLARKVRITAGRAARTRKDDVLALTAVVWTFATFALIDSRTEAAGAAYRVLDTFRIGP